MIQQYEHISNYVLNSKYALSNDDNGEDDHYIVDSSLNPFEDDILRIEALYNEEGLEIPLNDMHDVDYSYYLSSYNTIQVPYPDADNAFVVIYRANHAKIDTTLTDVTGVEIDLPDALEEALIYFVASKAFAIRSSTEAVNESANYYNKFLQAMNDVTINNTLNTSVNNTNLHLEMNGWS